MRKSRNPYKSLSPTVSGQMAHERLWAALVWNYGYERAQDIVSGKDEATNADIQAWRMLGVPK
jgi:type II secretory pathway component PulK